MGQYGPMGTFAREAPATFAALLFLQRTSQRFERWITSILQGDDAAQRPLVRDGFLWRSDQEPASYTGIRVPVAGDDATRRDAADIPLRNWRMPRS